MSLARRIACDQACLGNRVRSILTQTKCPGEIAQWLATCTGFIEDVSSVPRHCLQPSVSSVPGDSPPSPALHWHYTPGQDFPVHTHNEESSMFF